MESFLQKLGIKREDLNIAEKETLNKWLEALSKNQISVKEIQEYINEMISALEREAFGYDKPKGIAEYLFRSTRKKHLEARLQNYVMLRDFLTAPEKARSYVEKSLSNVVPK